MRVSSSEPRARHARSVRRWRVKVGAADAAPTRCRSPSGSVRSKAGAAGPVTCARRRRTAYGTRFGPGIAQTLDEGPQGVKIVDPSSLAALLSSRPSALPRRPSREVAMHCPRCRCENADASRFCTQCGARLVRQCGSCGADLVEGVRFCGQCGLAVDTPRPTQPRFASPEAYTPRHLAEKILTARPAIEGERKQLTVLFADLKSSMELMADRDPEQTRKLLDPVLEHMMNAVHHYEGTVNQVMGDGIMAVFGAPLAHEDHAVRACFAALRMQEAVRRYADEVRRAEGIPIQIRVGLNSGEVVVRSIGSDLHMDYTAVGQTTHLAARMEQMAMAGSILLSADALRLAEGFVEVKPLGPVNVKGLREPIEVYEVMGADPARTRLQAATGRGLTQFVGRGTELEQLRRAQQLAGSGRGQVAAIVGEAGVGKSRLLYEFTHTHRMQGARHAPPRRSLPPRPRQALPPHGQARAGSRTYHHRDEDVPRDGDDVLAGAGRGRD